MVAFGWSHQLAASSHPQYKPPLCLYRRNGGIRTRDPLLPKQVRYQAAPHSVFSLLCCRFTLWASDHLCSVFSKDSGPKSKPDAVSRWKGDFQRFRYLSVCPVQERGYVGMLFSRRQNHTQTPDGANVDFRSATPYVIPDHGVRRILLIREAGARS